MGHSGRRRTRRGVAWRGGEVRRTSASWAPAAPASPLLSNMCTTFSQHMYAEPTLLVVHILQNPLRRRATLMSSSSVWEPR